MIEIVPDKKYAKGLNVVVDEEAYRFIRETYVNEWVADRRTWHESSLDTRGGSATARAVSHLGGHERAMSWRATAPQRRRQKEGEPAGNIKADPATVAIVAEVQSPGGV